MEQLTREQAIHFFDSKKWESMSDMELAHFQANQQLLCCPFDKFHAAVEKVLKRPVWTHEFGLNADAIRSEINRLYSTGNVTPPEADSSSPK